MTSFGRGRDVTPAAEPMVTCSASSSTRSAAENLLVGGDRWPAAQVWSEDEGPDRRQRGDGSREAGMAVVLATTATPQQPNSGRDQRQIGDRRGQQELA